jgi:GT2 family glycosyltransferase
MTRVVRAVVLNYNDPGRTEACLDALAASENLDIRVLVVDNASAGDDVARLRARPGHHRVLALPANTGYSGGMNAGVAYWLAAARGGAGSGEQVPGEPAPGEPEPGEPAPGPDAPVLILTPDATVRPDTVRRLLDELDATPDAGVVGPVVVYHREAGLIGAGGVVDRRRVRAVPLRRPAGPEPYDTGFMDGCCLLIRPAALDGRPPFDERYFMYYEETRLCDRLRRDGWRVRLVPAAEVDHPKAVGAQPPHYFYYMARNRYRFWGDAHGVGWPRVALAHAMDTARTAAAALRAFLLPGRRGELPARIRDLRLQLRAVVRGTADHLAGRYGKMADGRMG